MIATDPDAAHGERSAAPELGRLFEQHRTQARLACGKSRRDSANARADHHDVVGLIQVHFGRSSVGADECGFHSILTKWKPHATSTRVPTLARHAILFDPIHAQPRIQECEAFCDAKLCWSYGADHFRTAAVATRSRAECRFIPDPAGEACCPVPARRPDGRHGPPVRPETV